MPAGQSLLAHVNRPVGVNTLRSLGSLQSEALATWVSEVRVCISLQQVQCSEGSTMDQGCCGFVQWAFNPAAEETLEALVQQGRVDAESWCGSPCTTACMPA